MDECAGHKACVRNSACTDNKETGNRQRRFHKHAGHLLQLIENIKLDGCQGKGLTVTSACDLGVMCLLGLFLLHAITAKGWHSTDRLTHAQGNSVQHVPVHGPSQP